jgi:hypothetical protein
MGARSHTKDELSTAVSEESKRFKEAAEKAPPGKWPGNCSCGELDGPRWHPS